MEDLHGGSQSKKLLVRVFVANQHFIQRGRRLVKSAIQLVLVHTEWNGIVFHLLNLWQCL